ncbi:ABC transporter ATP-binding protein [Clostridium sp. D33t1_170424_F3]|uniref:ABC transporter ATP-binding protein n=1 Tax=Clostridium sp. D33t1_170424_F3 TaxID=2787099 RepID=UPI0018A9926F|nr:ABC transporter ATP-binding protein [Clostridium sp. D33t1_170424_F3]
MEIRKEYAVQMHGITKRFGSFYALDGVNLDVEKGTIHSLLGENGAGKSTLMNILYGLYQADEGEIYLNGEMVAIKNPNVAISHGIGMVHQHFMLVDNFTVTQNIILGKEPVHACGILDMKKAREQVRQIVEKYGLQVDPDAKIEDISVGMQQRVEILKALYRGADLLILDEPTAVLTPQEIDELIQIMHNLVADGKTIIIITHKLKEIKASSDFCTVIRRGKGVDTVSVQDVNEEELASKMVGRAVRLVVEKTPAQPGHTVLELDRLTVAGSRGVDAVRELSLQVRRGEIVGIAGVDGNGQKELVEAITCLTGCKSGTIRINGVEVQNTTPRNVVDHKISTIHEDRQRRGLVLNFTVAENAVLEKYREKPFQKRGVLDRGKILSFADELIREYDVRPEDCAQQPVRGLSGGNQQKVIIAREVSNEPDVLIAVQPTRGLDVGAIEYVHRTLVRERDRGRAILLISLELDEVMHVSDRIAVLYNGQIVGEFQQEEADEKTIGLLMAGGKRYAENG